MKLVCFDKTGTLTEDGLDLYGLQTTKMSWKINDFAEETLESNIFQENISTNLTKLPTESLVVTCLASCHSLTIINEELTGKGWEKEGKIIKKVERFINT